MAAIFSEGFPIRRRNSLQSRSTLVTVLGTRRVLVQHCELMLGRCDESLVGLS